MLLHKIVPFAQKSCSFAGQFGAPGRKGAVRQAAVAGHWTQQNDHVGADGAPKHGRANPLIPMSGVDGLFCVTGISVGNDGDGLQCRWIPHLQNESPQYPRSTQIEQAMDTHGQPCLQCFARGCSNPTAIDVVLFSKKSAILQSGPRCRGARCEHVNEASLKSQRAHPAVRSSRYVQHVDA